LLTVRTVDGPPFVAGTTPLAPDRPYQPYRPAGPETEQVFGLHNPVQASSSEHGHGAPLANDSNPASYWRPAGNDGRPWIIVDPERILTYRRLNIRFAPGNRCGVSAEAQAVDGSWQALGGAMGTADTLDLATPAVSGKSLRLSLNIPAGASCGIAEIGITGTLRRD
jgi:hypothetical protein